jgi:cell filamentation protein
MPDSKYCYPDSDVLKNKLNIQNAKELFFAERDLTLIRLQELQNNPIRGNFDFDHLKRIHHYIFQDLYEWAGKVRTVEIGKGNLFCTTACIDSYAESVFSKYYSQCMSSKNDFDQFVKVFAENYGDLNALHPFREGNGRAQREFARSVCLECGYAFDISHTTHKEMLEASILSFNKADNSLFCDIFRAAVIPISEYIRKPDVLYTLSSDDLKINNFDNHYDYYDSNNQDVIREYDELYAEKALELAEAGNENIIEEYDYNDIEP